MEHIFINPLFASLFAWLAFNVIMLRMAKDVQDDKGEAFSLSNYVQKTWDNWLASLVCVPVLLYIGMSKLDIGAIDAGALQWSDLYYLLSGFLPELVIVMYKKWKQKTFNS